MAKREVPRAKGDKNVKRVQDENRQLTRKRNAHESKQQNDDNTVKKVIEGK